jgi:hypothetical protein
VIVSAPVETFGQTNEAQFYVSMSRARRAMFLFTDCKWALREAVTRPSERISPLEWLPELETADLQEQYALGMLASTAATGKSKAGSS